MTDAADQDKHVENGMVEPDFLEALADKDENSVDLILKRSTLTGFEEDFSEVIYRENYMDAIEEILSAIPEPPHEDEDLPLEDRQFLVEEAFGKGVKDRVIILAKDALAIHAKKALEVQGEIHDHEEEYEED